MENHELCLSFANHELLMELQSRCHKAFTNSLTLLFPNNDTQMYEKQVGTNKDTAMNI